jgi:hypothetical protein
MGMDKVESPIPEPQMDTNRDAPWRKHPKSTDAGRAYPKPAPEVLEKGKNNNDGLNRLADSRKSTLLSLKYKSPTKAKPAEVVIPKTLFQARTSLQEPTHPKLPAFERTRTRTLESKTSTEPVQLDIPPPPSLSPVKSIAKELAAIYESFVNRTLLEIENRVQSVVYDNTEKEIVREAVTARMEKTLAFKQKLLQIQQLQ